MPTYDPLPTPSWSPRVRPRGPSPDERNRRYLAREERIGDLRRRAAAGESLAISLLEAEEGTVSGRNWAAAAPDPSGQRRSPLSRFGDMFREGGAFDPYEVGRAQERLPKPMQMVGSLGRSAIGLGLRLGHHAADLADVITPSWMPGDELISRVEEVAHTADTEFQRWSKETTSVGDQRAGRITETVADVAGHLGEYMVGGRLIRGGIKKTFRKLGGRSAHAAREVVEEASKKAALKTSLRALPGNVALDALAYAPLDVAYATHEETSPTYMLGQWDALPDPIQGIAQKLGKTHLGRAVGDVALGVTGDVLLRGIGAGIKSVDAYAPEVIAHTGLLRGDEMGAALNPFGIRDPRQARLVKQLIQAQQAGDEAAERKIASQLENIKKELEPTPPPTKVTDDDWAEVVVEEQARREARARDAGIDPATLDDTAIHELLPLVERAERSQIVGQVARAGREARAVDDILKSIGLEPGSSLKQLGEAFETRARKKYDRKLDITTKPGKPGEIGEFNKPEDVAKVVGILKDEALLALRGDNSAIHWYRERLEEAMQIWATVDSSIAKGGLRTDAARFALAITSNGQSVMSNAKFSMEVFDHYKKNGRFPVVGTGKEKKAMQKAFRMWNDLADDLGPEEVFRFMDTEVTPKILRQYGFDATGELANTILPASVIFGPKVGGGFYRNLGGFFDEVTMDRWFRRSIGRITGDMMEEATTESIKTAHSRFAKSIAIKTLKDVTPEELPKALRGLPRNAADRMDRAKEISSHWEKRRKELVAAGDASPEKPEWALAAENFVSKEAPIIREAPKSGAERGALRKIVGMLQESLEAEGVGHIDAASLQALLWYPEKRLYRGLGVASGQGDDIDYADAFRKILGGTDEGARSIDEELVAGRVVSALRTGQRLAGPTGTRARQGLGDLAPEGITGRGRKAKATVGRIEETAARRRLVNTLHKPTAAKIVGLEPFDTAVPLASGKKINVTAFDVPSSLTELDEAATKLIKHYRQGTFKSKPEWALNAEKYIRSRNNGYTLYSTVLPFGIPSAAVRTSGLIGGAAGAVLDEDDPVRGALLGAGITGGTMAAARYIGPVLKAGHDRATAKMGALREADARRTDAQAKSLTVGEGDLTVIDRVLQVFGKDNPVSRTYGSMSKAGTQLDLGQEAPERLLTAFERMRTSGFRLHFPLEKLEIVGQKLKKKVVPPIKELASELRGYAVAAEPYIMDRLLPVLLTHGKYADMGATLAKALRTVEIDQFNPGKIREDAVVDALETIKILKADPDAAHIEAASKALFGYYRTLLKMKRDAGVISQKEFTRITKQGDSYIPFLSEKLARREGLGGGATNVYAPNTTTGIREFTKGVNEAITVHPFEQAIKDTYETFQRIRSQRLTNAVAAFAPDKRFQKWIIKLDERPEGRPEVGEYVRARVDGVMGHYWVRDPDLAKAWSSINTPDNMNVIMKTGDVARRFMQAGVTMNPTFMVRNGIRDFVMTAVQKNLNEDIGLGRVPTEVQMGVGAAGGLATKDEDETMLGAMARGATIAVAPHLLTHAGRVALAMNDVLGAHRMGTVGAGLTGYITASDDDTFSQKLIRVGTFGVAGRALGVGLHSTKLGKFVPEHILTAAKGNRKAYQSFKRAGAANFGLYDSTPKGAQRQLQDLLNSGVDSGDVLEVKSWGEAIELFMHPINQLIQNGKNTLRVDVSSWRNAGRSGKQFVDLAHQAFIEPMSNIGMAIETAPRLESFKRQMRLQGPKGETAHQARARIGADYDAAIAAPGKAPVISDNMKKSMTVARDLSLDFAVKPGNKLIRGLTKVTPFLNPTLQGVDKLGRMLADPQTAGVAAATIIAPSIWLWQLNNSDPDVALEYQGRPDWERNSYWLLSKKMLKTLGMGTEDSGFYRMAKPFELGYMFASVPERILDYMRKKNSIGLNLQLADAFPMMADVFLDFAGSFMSPSLPLIGGPTIMAGGGWFGGPEHGFDTFTKRPINPMPWSAIGQTEQMSPFTTWPAVAAARFAQDMPGPNVIAGITGANSPAKWDYLIKAYTGSLGHEAALIMDDMAKHYGWDTRVPASERRSYLERSFETNPQTATQYEIDLRDFIRKSGKTKDSMASLETTDPVYWEKRMDKRSVQEMMMVASELQDYEEALNDYTKTRRDARNGVGDYAPPVDGVGGMSVEERAGAIVDLTLAIAGIARIALYGEPDVADSRGITGLIDNFRQDWKKGERPYGN